MINNSENSAAKLSVGALVALFSFMLLDTGNAFCAPPISSLVPINKALKSVGDVNSYGLVAIGGSAATITKQNGILEVNSTAPGTQVWNIQVNHYDAPLKDGMVCQLSFRAKADRAMPMDVSAQIMGPDYHQVGLYDTVALTQTWKPFVTRFTVANVATKHVMCPQFFIGTHVAKVWISDIMLRVLSTGEPTVPTAPGSTTAANPLVLKAGEVRMEGPVRDVMTGDKWVAFWGKVTDTFPGMHAPAFPGATKAVWSASTRGYVNPPGSSMQLDKIIPGHVLTVIGTPTADGRKIRARIVLLGPPR